MILNKCRIIIKQFLSVQVFMLYKLKYISMLCKKKLFVKKKFFYIIIL